MLLAENRRARFDYHIEEKYEAGICLEGWEVKSIRDHRGHLVSSFVSFSPSGEAFIKGMQITPLPTATQNLSREPFRDRKLLLNRRELNKLSGKVKTAGFTVVPLALILSGNKVKVEIGLAKGKKLHDKRATERERDMQKQARQLIG